MSPGPVPPGVRPRACRFPALILAVLLPLLAAAGCGEVGAEGEGGGTAAAGTTLAALHGAVRDLPVVVTGGMVPVGDAVPPPGWLDPAAAAAPADRRTLQRRLDRAAGLYRVSHVGIHVRELESGETVYARAADEASILASNTKLFTTAAAVDALGPGAFLETRLLARGRVDGDGVLHGDLAVVGAGDPTFSWRQSLDGDPVATFRAWAAALRRRGVTAVDGQLYLDHGLFEAARVHPDWDPVKRLKWYQAPVEALGFHENVVTVKTRPAGRPGLPARVELRPDLASFQVDSTVLTTPSWRGNRLLVHRAEGDDRVSVAGGIYLRANEVATSIAVDAPTGFFGDALAATLAEEGVPVRGRRVPVPVLPGLAWEPVAVHRTALLDVLEATNHESQNLFAESLIKLVGARRCGSGSWEAGTRAATELAQELALELGEGAEGAGGPVLRDGSGMSRRNVASPRQLTTFLAGMARHPQRDAFLASLPTGGEAGTSLSDRLDEPPYAGSVWAKTGTLNGVSALSGYARGASGRIYAVSVLNRGSIWHGRQIQDAVMRAVVDLG